MSDFPTVGAQQSQYAQCASQADSDGERVSPKPVRCSVYFGSLGSLWFSSHVNARGRAGPQHCARGGCAHTGPLAVAVEEREPTGGVRRARGIGGRRVGVRARFVALGRTHRWLFFQWDPAYY